MFLERAARAGAAGATRVSGAQRTRVGLGIIDLFTLKVLRSLLALLLSDNAKFTFDTQFSRDVHVFILGPVVEREAPSVAFHLEK